MPDLPVLFADLVRLEIELWDAVEGRLRAELEHMSADDREILTLRYALDYDAADIAHVLEINTTAVHMRLSRARQRLGERLTAKGVVEVS